MEPKNLSLPEMSRFQRKSSLPDLRYKSKSIPLFSKRRSISSLRYFLRPKVIGRGRYSTVKLATDARSFKTVAAKIIDLSKFLDTFKQEVESLSRLEHPNIVTLYHVEITNYGKGILFLEYLHKYTLADFIDDVGSVVEAVAMRIMDPLVAGLAYAHGKCVCHNDIKPENIAYDPSTGIVKLFDFGLSSIVNPAIAMIEFHGGSPLYMAPEVLLKSHNPFLSDIWSVGITLYEMLVGQPPFYYCTDLKELTGLLALGSSQITFPESLSIPVKNLLVKMLDNTPESRIQWPEIQDEIKLLL